MIEWRKRKLITFIIVLLLWSSYGLTQEKIGFAEKYIADVTLLPDTASSEGELTVTWKNNSDHILKSIPFGFLNIAKRQDIIKECLVNGSPAKYEYFEPADIGGGNGVSIILANPVKPGEQLEIKIKYSSIVVQSSYGYLKYIMGWIPQAFVVKDGKYSLYNQASSDWEMMVTMPSDYKAAFSGLIISREEKNGKTTYKTAASGISNYGILVSKDFIIEQDEVDKVKIFNYYFKGDEKWSRKLMEYAKDVIHFYKEKLGFYPQSVLSILPGSPIPQGGYPICSNCIVIHRGLDLLKEEAETFAKWITAHEIGHQYWGYGYIYDDLIYPRWFGLSMGIYTDRMYVSERVKDSSRYNRFRKSYMAGLLAGVDTTILQKESELDKQGFDYNNVISHGKSWTVLVMLEELLGKEVFYNIYTTCLKEFKGMTVTLDMFESTCEKISGKDLGWFFDQWYRTPAVLDYRIKDVRTSFENGEYFTDCTIERMGDAFMPLELALTCADGKAVSTVLDSREKKILYTFRTKSAPLKVQLDPQKKLPLVSSAEQDPETLILAVRELDSMTKITSAWKLLQAYKDFNKDMYAYYYYLGKYYRYVGDFPAALDCFKKVLDFTGKMEFEAYIKPMAILNLGITNDQMGNRAEAQKYYYPVLINPITNNWAKQYLAKPYSNRK